MQDYDNALKLCSGPGQRDTVYHTMALAAASNGDYKTAAAQYAKIVGGKPTFEDLALQLVDAGDPEALQIFLATKLQVGHDQRICSKCNCAGICPVS